MRRVASLITHAVVAIGFIAEPIEPEMSHIIPTERVGSSVCLRTVLRKGFSALYTPRARSALF